jgi:predicted TIM-barrel fold metal-dependent hydrolase
MKSYINFVRQLDIPEEKKEMIFWKNAAQLFKIPVENLKAEKLTNAKA